MNGDVFSMAFGYTSPACARRSKLRQTKAVASYRTPRSRLGVRQACLPLVSRQLAAAPRKIAKPGVARQILLSSTRFMNRVNAFLMTFGTKTGPVQGGASFARSRRQQADALQEWSHDGEPTS